MQEKQKLMEVARKEQELREAEMRVQKLKEKAKWKSKTLKDL